MPFSGSIGEPANPKQESLRWQALERREAPAGDHFFYGVRTTGVFCRPGCPSRRPRRNNVSFFSKVEDALSAGFRACRRCHPLTEGADRGLRDKILRVCAHLDASTDGTPTLEELGDLVGMSGGHLQRVFKRTVGVSPKAYADALRINRLKESLREGEGIAAASFGAGFGSSSRLYESANTKLGMSPSTYREKGRGLRIRHAVARSALGQVLVAATDSGLCAVRLGDSSRQLRDELREEFSEATIGRPDAELKSWLSALVAHIDSGTPLVDMPRDVAATAFQRRVWEAIRDIPTGETRSYGELAQAIGKPKAVRAVASACAKNPLALVVPCHRVLPATGKTGGYRWGTERKAELLQRESSASGRRSGSKR